ncbi:hypothetical protein KQ298_00260 [Synechococcus sp. CS-1330]|nr:hypothetical protein [Synechococcus sp. CS-1330]
MAQAFEAEVAVAGEQLALFGQALALVADAAALGHGRQLDIDRLQAG